VAKYADVLETCVKNGYKPEEFLSRCRDEGLNITATDAHLDLYKELVKLDKANKNGIWARIIKNNFAPLFVSRVDFVAGNPPWIFWNNLPEEYRLDVRKIMGDRYGLIKTKASKMEKLGQTGKDISELFFYVGLDAYAKKSGRLGFVITQTVFQSTAGEEFRRFSLPDGTPIRILRVNDWVDVQPFAAATNRTSVVCAQRGLATTYPLAYIKWRPKRDFDVDTEELDEVIRACKRANLVARPASKSILSGWLIAPPGLVALPRVEESAMLRPRKGVQTSAEAVFRLVIEKEASGNRLVVHNDISKSKIPVRLEYGAIEKDLVYPFTTGAGCERWRAKSVGYYVVPHTPKTGMKPIGETEMKGRYPGAFEFLKKHESPLLGRAVHKLWGPENPFYSLYNIGPYSFANFKLVWPDVTNQFACAVISKVEDPILGDKLLIPNNTLLMIPFDSEAEPHFCSALLNSSVGRFLIQQSIVLHATSEILKVAPIPKYNHANTDHVKLSGASKLCHAATEKGDTKRVAALEAEIDKAAAKLWGITDDELKAIQDALAQTKKSKRRAKDEDEDE